MRKRLRKLTTSRRCPPWVSDWCSPACTVPWSSGRHAAASLLLAGRAGAVEVQQAHQVVVAQAHQFEAEAHNHAQAQTHLTVQAHNLAAKAQAHAHAQVCITLPWQFKELLNSLAQGLAVAQCC